MWRVQHASPGPGLRAAGAGRPDLAPNHLQMLAAPVPATVVAVLYGVEPDGSACEAP